MTHQLDKGTTNSGNSLRPYVLLPGEIDPKAYKVPVYEDWQGRLVSLYEANSWVYLGGGLGLALHWARTVSCLEIPSSSDEAYIVANWFGDRGCLVCRTPSGFHIFLRRPKDAPPPGRCKLECGDLTIDVEWHPGGAHDVTMIVLPITGTPFERLGGAVYIANKKVISRACGLAELESWFAALPDVPLNLQPVGSGSPLSSKPDIPKPLTAPELPISFDQPLQLDSPMQEEASTQPDLSKPPKSTTTLSQTSSSQRPPQPRTDTTSAPERRHNRDSGDPLRPYVRLAKTEEPAGHKQPVEPGWQKKQITLSEAQAWVKSGGGLGLALHHTAIACVDIDDDGEEAEYAAMWYGQRGCLVCRSLRGYHIFLKSPKDAPPPGRYRLRVDDGLVEVEWHPGGPGDVRQIVLPVLGTPRAFLGGEVFMAYGTRVGRPCSLEELEDCLASLPEVVIELEPIGSAGSFTRAPSGSGKGAPRHIGTMGEDPTESEDAGFAHKVWGGIPSLDAFRKWARSLREGERHTMLTKAAASLASLGAFEHLFALYDLAEEVFRGEKTAREEVVKICTSAIRKYAMTRLGSGEPSKRPRGRPGVTEKIEEVMKYLREKDCKKHIDGDGERFLLVDSAAISVSGFWGFLNSEGIVISETTAKAAFERAFKLFEFASDVAVIRAKPIWRDGKAYFKFKVGAEVRVLRVSEEGHVWLEDPSQEGIYLSWGDYSGRTYYADIKREEVRKTIETFSRFAQIDDPSPTALFAHIILGQGTGALIIEGPSGSGKSTLSKLIQAVADGADLVSMNIGNDIRDWRAISQRKWVLGIDESTPSQDLENFIKTAISGGKFLARRLYTSSGTDVVSVNASAIFSSITIEKIAADTARRSIVISLEKKGGRSDLSESEFLDFLNREADRMYSALIHLLPRVLKVLRRAEDKVVLEESGDFFPIIRNAEIPDWAHRDSKRDWAVSAWAWSRVLGCEEALKNTWKKLRGEARLKGLGIWEDVIKLIEEDADFATQMRQGITYGDIAKRMTQDEEGESGGDNEKSIAAKLRRTARQVQTALTEEGWMLELERGRARGHSRWIVRLYKEVTEDSEREDGGGESPHKELPF